ncbi:MAG: Type 1 glutamine amidotransferase-like domain-containing protein [Solirubrobacteraceae bacterium]
MSDARGPAGVFLIGGGREDEQVRASHAPFVAACGGGPIVAFALEDPARWEAALRLAGAGEVRCLAAPPTAADLNGAAGVFVAGGLTPAYQEALAGWRAPAHLPYCGFSAGAAIAAHRAIVGGWRRGGRPVLDEDFAEGLDEIEVRDGLGVVEFAVDVHAAQWGTLSRLIAAVSAGLVDEGYAIDEGTVLVADGPEPRVAGLGHAWRVRTHVGNTVVSVLHH